VHHPVAKAKLHPWWYQVKMQELLWRVDLSIFRKYDPKFDIKSTKLLFGD
jgi:hypothetical protein